MKLTRIEVDPQGGKELVGARYGSNLRKRTQLEMHWRHPYNCGGEAFHAITRQRRENILKVTDPSFVQLLGDSSAFSVRESGRLFGSKFISRIVLEAQEERALRSMAPIRSPMRAGRIYVNNSRSQFAGRGAFRLSTNRFSSTDNRQR